MLKGHIMARGAIVTMGQTLTWEGSAENFRPLKNGDRHVIHYKGVFLHRDLDFDPVSETFYFNDGASAEDVAAEFVDDWGTREVSAIANGASLVFDWNNRDEKFAAIHAFRLDGATNGMIVTQQKQPILPKLFVSTDYSELCGPPSRDR